MRPNKRAPRAAEGRTPGRGQVTDILAHNGPELQPLLVDDRGAARLLGISRSHLRRLHAAGRLPAPIRLGRRVLWLVAELEAWSAAGAPRREKWEAMRDGGRP